MYFRWVFFNYSIFEYFFSINYILNINIFFSVAWDVQIFLVENKKKSFFSMKIKLHHCSLTWHFTSNLYDRWSWAHIVLFSECSTSVSHCTISAKDRCYQTEFPWASAAPLVYNATYIRSKTFSTLWKPLMIHSIPKTVWHLRNYLWLIQDKCESIMDFTWGDKPSIPV